MKSHSPGSRIAAPLALAALALASIPVATPARAAGHAHQHATHPVAAHAGRGCRGSRCVGDTGGTPAVARAKVPRTARRTRDGDPRQPKQHTAKATPSGETTPPGEPAPPKSDEAVIAAVLATTCADTELTPTAEDLPLIRGAVLCLINRERAEHGLDPLITNGRLEEAAEGHCAELISDDYFAHISPSGETPVERIRKTGYIPNPSDGYVIGENLAWGTYSLSTPAAIVAAWIASPGHLANILESQYTETGIGIVPAVPASLSDGSPGASYAQEFGVIIP